MVNKVVSDLDAAPAVADDMVMLVEDSVATYKATVGDVTKAVINDTQASANTTYSSNKINEVIGQTAGTRIDDDNVATTTTYSSSKIMSIVGDIETLLSEV